MSPTILRGVSLQGSDPIMPERIKVIFNRVFVKNDADWLGSGEFYFIVKVDGVAVGDRRRIFDARQGAWINLPAAQWSREVDVTAKPQVVVSFHGMDTMRRRRPIEALSGRTGRTEPPRVAAAPRARATHPAAGVVVAGGANR